jgi:hypothetical protein
LAISRYQSQYSCHRKLVERRRRVAEPVFLQRCARLGDAPPQPALDPHVRERRRRSSWPARVEAVEVREDQPRGVPDLVGEVPVALDAVLGDPDVASLSERGQGEAEGVVPYFSMTTSGSATLPFDFDIFWPSASRTIACRYTSRNGTSFMKWIPSIAMRATQKKRMSGP